ncbi:hypothetical protein [Streptomyces chartreusis]|uniref:hypothetical protein n=1 Tax=Streptomyces chartreusis TaxID=1969 RepID=UPI003680B298
MLLRWLISIASESTGSPYTPSPELGPLTQLEIRRTPFARAREVIDYRTFRDIMAENARDYELSSKTIHNFFATMQTEPYLHVVGMAAEEIKQVRNIVTGPGVEEGRPEPSAKDAAGKVAKDYLTEPELRKLERACRPAVPTRRGRRG